MQRRAQPWWKKFSLAEIASLGCLGFVRTAGAMPPACIGEIGMQVLLQWFAYFPIHKDDP